MAKRKKAKKRSTKKKAAPARKRRKVTKSCREAVDQEKVGPQGCAQAPLGAETSSRSRRTGAGAVLEPAESTLAAVAIPALKYQGIKAKGGGAQRRRLHCIACIA